MLFQTPIIISKRTPLNIQDKIFCIGSCFAEEVCERMVQNGIDAVCNPFGTMYNPLSIAACIERFISGHLFEETELIEHDGLYHSMLHHGRFSFPTLAETLSAVNQSIEDGRRQLQAANVVIITLGTAWIYEMEGKVVGNCHKLPANHFERRRLSVEEVREALTQLLQNELFQGKRVIFTVSPIRHKKDGLHENQLSKSTLLLALDQVIKGTAYEYFPSYEILLDELRDYRFFAEDMVHPTKQAVDYVWERFLSTYFSVHDQEQMRLAFNRWKSSQHIPLH